MIFFRAILIASVLMLVTNHLEAQVYVSQKNCGTELFRYNARASATTDNETGKWYRTGWLSLDGPRARYYWTLGLGSPDNKVKDGCFDLDLDSTKKPEFTITITATGADIYIKCNNCIANGDFRPFWEDQPAPLSKMLIWHFSNDRISDALKAREVLNDCLLKK